MLIPVYSYPVVNHPPVSGCRELRLVFSPPGPSRVGDSLYALGEMGPEPPSALVKSTKLGADGLLLMPPPVLAVLRLGERRLLSRLFWWRFFENWMNAWVRARRLMSAQGEPPAKGKRLKIL